MIDINTNMHKLIENLGIDTHTICELGEISPSQYSRVKKNFRKLPFLFLVKLSDRLEIDFDNLISGNIDYKTLKEHFSGNKSYIPERYQNYQMSKVDTINNFVDYAKKKIPKYYIDKVLRKFQINSSILCEPNRNISGLLAMDMFNEIGSYNLPNYSFQELGENLCKRHSAAVIKKARSEKINKPQLVFEAFIENIDKNVERNMSYRILHSDKKRIILSATTREETQDNLKLQNFGNEFHYQNIEGYYKTISTCFYSSPTKMTRLKSWKGFDSELILEIDYSHLRQSQFLH